MTFIKVKRRGKSNNLYRGIDLEEHTEKGHMEEHLEEGASEHLEEEHLVVPHLIKESFCSDNSQKGKGGRRNAVERPKNGKNRRTSDAWRSFTLSLTLYLLILSPS